MNIHRFSLAGERLEARPTRTLWWPNARLLAVADLHLGKSERMARRGGAMLPPYETLDTLARLRAEIEALSPDHVIALGDSFDDTAAARALPADVVATLTDMVAGQRWTWITGNHDPGRVDLPGDLAADIQAGPLTFRHIADPKAGPGELSGHYHPKARLPHGSRPCFLIDSHRAILPAFGTYTGGLDACAPPLLDLMGADAQAVLTGSQTLTVRLFAPEAKPARHG
ncbi:MAG: ligase-associated DNA damage response endonuclease PdeM [Pseudomonadota bacterium]